MILRLALPIALALGAGLAFATLAFATEDEKPAAEKVAAKPAVDMPFHGNEVCPVTQKPIRKNKFVEKDGERVYVCCNSCRKKVKADFKTYRDQTYPAADVVELKNAHCPIMGGEVDGETSVVFQNYRVQFCCPGCDGKFQADPRKHLTLLLNPELVSLDNKRCPVMPEEPSEADSFFVYDGVVIDTCCSDCPEMFTENPTRYLEDAGIDLAKVKEEAAAGK